MAQCKALAGKQWEDFFSFFNSFKALGLALVQPAVSTYHGQHGILSMLSLPFLFRLSVSVTWPLCPISGRLGATVSNMLSEAQAAGV